MNTLRNRRAQKVLELKLWFRELLDFWLGKLDNNYFYIIQDAFQKAVVGIF